MLVAVPCAKGQRSKSVLSSPLQQGVTHQESAGNLKSVSFAQGFPSQQIGSRVQTAAVQSSPTHQGVHRAPSSGLTMYLPSKKLQPPSHVPARTWHQGYPQQLPYPSQSRPVSMLLSQTQNGGDGLASNSQSSYGGQHQSSTWSALQPGSQSTSQLDFGTLGDQCTRMTSGLTSASDGYLASPFISNWQSSSHDQTTRSQMQASGMSSCDYKQSVRDAAQSSTSYGDLPSQVGSTWQTSSLSDQSQLQRSTAGETSTSQQSGRDALQKSSSYYVPLALQDAGIWQSARSPMQDSHLGSGMTSTSQQSTTDVQKSNSRYGPLYSQGTSTWQPFGRDQTAESQMQGSSVSSCGYQQPTSDVPQSGSILNGALPPQVANARPTSSLQSFLQSAQSQTPSISAALTPISQPYAGDLSQSGNYSRPLPAQGASELQPTGRHHPALQTAGTQMQGSSEDFDFFTSKQSASGDAQSSRSSNWTHPQGVGTWQVFSQKYPVGPLSAGVTSTSQQSGRAVPQHSSYYGPVDSRVASNWQPASHDQTAQFQMPASSVGSCDHQQSASDAAQKSRTLYGDLPSRVASTRQTSSHDQTAQTQMRGLRGYSGSQGSPSYTFTQNLPGSSSQSEAQLPPIPFSWMVKQRVSA
ncbi:hypothetical protein P4O66_000979 [Electrophorus voltai]|uniref:Uncharacterized protein n=1 Tax=Electrophorus voltai TaxID=2609070 RepID=A0AAD9DXS4_9TELE|nr:hypothetical protein P4O66_000979 [Electrophorus voltai]